MLISNRVFKALGQLAIVLAQVLILSGPVAFADEHRPLKEQSPPDIFVFLVDISGSMNDRVSLAKQPQLTKLSKLNQVKNRLERLAREMPSGTRVIVSTFDDQWAEQCDVVLNSSGDREQLNSKINGIRSRERATVLWGSVAKELARAERLVAAGNRRVRLVVYSDGDDSDDSPVVNHDTLLKRYGHVIDRHIQFDWVTLGYDLKPLVKDQLELLGVEFSTELTPLRVDFSLSQLRLHANRPVRLTGHSFGLSITGRGVDWGDGSREVLKMHTGDDRPIIDHQFKKPGTYDVRYVVVTKSGQRGAATKQVTVLPPQITNISIQSVDKAVVGDSVSLRANPVRNDLSYRWAIVGSSGIFADGSEVEFHAQTPGQMRVKLTVTDQHGSTASAERSIEVSKPEFPTFRIESHQQTVEVNSLSRFSVHPNSRSFSYVWSAADGQTANGATARFQFQRTGTELVQLLVQDQWGQSREESLNIHVEPPPGGPNAEFTIPVGLKLLLETPISLVAGGAEPSDQIQWFVNSRPVSNQRAFVFRPESYGDFELSLEVVDKYGRRDRTNRKLTIPRPEAPAAGIELASRQVELGTEIIWTDSSVGTINSCRYEITGHKPMMFDEASLNGRQRAFRLRSDRVGTLQITQTVVGPGGQDTALATVKVVPRGQEISPQFLITPESDRGTTEVSFLNRSSGDVYRCSLVPGDGADPIVVDGIEDLRHVYEPGDWQPTIVLYPQPGSGWKPVEWQGEVIHVKAPYPAWLFPVAASLPLGLLGLCGLALGGRWWADRAFERTQRLVNGHLTVRSLDNPLDVTSHEFDGVNEIEKVLLPDGMQVLLSTEIDPQLGDANLFAEFDDPSDGTKQKAEMVSSDELRVGSFLLSFTK